MLLRVVLDTNVIVSALLHPGRTPDRAIQRFLALGGRLVLDERILGEYRAVVVRPKFSAVPVERREALLWQLLAASDAVEPAGLDPARDGALTDPKDRMFVEVARSAAGPGVDAIVTGNAKHFPADAVGVAVWSPADWLVRLDS